jgi:hypothetical protein
MGAPEAVLHVVQDTEDWNTGTNARNRIPRIMRVGARLRRRELRRRPALTSAVVP